MMNSLLQRAQKYHLYLLLCPFLFFFFQNSTDSVYQGLWSSIQRFQKSDPTILSLNVSAMAKKVRTENFVLLLPETDSLNMFADDCNIILQDTSLPIRMQAPIVPKSSVLAKPLSDV